MSVPSAAFILLLLGWISIPSTPSSTDFGTRVISHPEFTKQSISLSTNLTLMYTSSRSAAADPMDAPLYLRAAASCVQLRLYVPRHTAFPAGAWLSVASLTCLVSRPCPSQCRYWCRCRWTTFLYQFGNVRCWSFGAACTISSTGCRQFLSEHRQRLLSLIKKFVHTLAEVFFQSIEAIVQIRQRLFGWHGRLNRAPYLRFRPITVIAPLASVFLSRLQLKRNAQSFVEICRCTFPYFQSKVSIIQCINISHMQSIHEHPVAKLDVLMPLVYVHLGAMPIGFPLIYGVSVAISCDTYLPIYFRCSSILIYLTTFLKYLRIFHPSPIAPWPLHPLTMLSCALTYLYFSIHYILHNSQNEARKIRTNLFRRRSLV